jgi:acyl-CoA thioesterase
LVGRCNVANENPVYRPGINPFGDLIGLEFTACEAGRSRCILQVAPRLLNPHGVVHGGVTYSMADTGMGAAVYSVMEGDELCATVEMKITYLRPARSGTLVCETWIITRGKRIAALESEISSDGQLVAKASGTYSIFRGREP